MRFTGKVVLVTGATRNTGLGIAARFAAEGARVLLNGRDAAAVDRAVAGLHRRGLKRVEGLPGDIGVPADVAEMFRRIDAGGHRLDVVVNNAAHLGIAPPLLDTDLAAFEDVVRVNLIGTFQVTLLAAQRMRRRGGAIVHIGSNVSTRAIRGRTAYVASKGGIDAMTLAMAVELGPHRIRVNTVAPGYIHTDRWGRLAGADRSRRRRNVPLGREATADDVADAVLFLASDQAANITGARLVVDGGCSAQHLPVDTEV